jgi:alkanesulfonate monooxygenase SsuD/methylene tetrahydromethanopterin reductase-like flavin-dependent oxidoreductase (luciferase family)
MADAPRLTPLFGMSIIPAARDTQRIFALARLADDVGLDFITAQDHPYNATFLDTWTLLAALGATTKRARLLPNVANLPLRPPAVLAKAAASLDIITNGRVEMGLGAGGFWEGIGAYGGPQRTPGEALGALAEAIQIMRALWGQTESGQAVRFAGRYYQLNGAQPGPLPAHPISIWVGGYGPRMLRLIGRSADVWLPSSTYVPPEQVPPLQTIINDAAQQAGRSPASVRRAYNIAGAILQPGRPGMTPRRPGIIVGSVEQWVATLTSYYRNLQMDTFIFWPAMRGDEEGQLRIFAEQVVSGVRAAVGSPQA